MQKQPDESFFVMKLLTDNNLNKTRVDQNIAKKN